MNNLSIFGQPGRRGTDGAAPQRPDGIVIGIAVSLLLHALLVLGFHGPRRPVPEPDKAVQPLTVWLTPAPTAMKAPAVAAPLEAPSQTSKPAQKKPQRVSDSAPRATAPPQTIIAVPAPVPADNASTVHGAPNGGDPADPFAASAPAPAQPGFDIEAARRVARKVASERDPARVGTAVGQIPDKPLKDQSDLAHDIDSGKRGNCKDGVPGGLLAPLLLLMDKKDSGCKW